VPAVANNDQIVEGIAEGVYAAVTAAMQNNSQSAHYTIELDGRVLYDSIVAEDKKSARRTGRTAFAF